MWDRFRGAVPQKLGRSHQQQHQQQPQYGAGGDQFHGAPRNGYHYSIQGGPAPTRPPREFRGLAQQQQMQPQAEEYYVDDAPAIQEPPRRNPYRDSPPLHLDPPAPLRDRPASSIYSQPSPIQTSFPPSAPRRNYAYHDAEGISPPSSPEPFNPKGNGIPHPVPDISPIDEDDEDEPAMISQKQQQGATGQQQQAVRGSIPAMRRERRQKADAAAGGSLRESRSREHMRSALQPRPAQTSARGYHGGEVRWDPATGEQTSSAKGRPSQVKPAEYAKGFGHSPETPQRRGVGVAGVSPVGSSMPFGERVKRIAPPGFATGGAERNVQGSPHESQASAGSPRHLTSPPASSPSFDPAAGAFTSDRPAWKGASGRSAIVAPVRDTPDVAPLSIPRKSSKRGPRSPTAGDAAAAGSGGASSGTLDTILASPPVSPLGPAESQSQLAAEQQQQQQQQPTIRQITPSSQLAPLEAPRGMNPVADYPSPPYSGGDIVPPETVNTQPAALTLSPATLTPTSGIRRKPTPSSQSHHQTHDSVSSIYSQSDPYNYKHYTATTTKPPSGQSNPNTTTTNALPPDGWTQPPSRFSVTTYATSARDATPRPSTDHFDDGYDDGYETPPPIPASNLRALTDPTTTTSTAIHHESVMDRRRPKLGGGGGSPANDDEPVVISLRDAQWMKGRGAPQESQRKPLAAAAAINKDNGSGLYGVSSQQQQQQQQPRRAESISSMAGSIYKSLPPAPPETSAKDRVDALNARLRALANRRINITRSVKQMTELMPTDNIMASAEVLRKREVERLKVEALRLELAEVQREEYELGIKLHRAYKRIDREAEYEPTTLWVRRVTG